jgi:hypothetical protein
MAVETDAKAATSTAIPTAGALAGEAADLGSAIFNAVTGN